MIINGILLLVEGILNVFLAPLTILNIGVDFLSSIPVIGQFLQVVSYLLPWSNIMPLIVLSIAILIFKINFKLVKTIWDFVPFV